ncbi:Ninjurin-1 [Orchesella cincta]|uniref:Ninjurin-1 n=1 Tax=Orchesella cincta TaxID=48709 RepID=A0A1D2MKZ8_ORCCI|nr:Ninjurin-1 [Orchesella cincta]
MEINKVDVTNNEEGIGDSIFGFLRSFNSYATKKTLGQGALDLALLAANISKLTTVLDRKKKDGVYYVLTVIICLSIGLQLIVGVLMGVIGKMDLKTEQQRKVANILNNIITVMVSVICVINIVLSVIDVSAPIANQAKSSEGS